MKYRNGLTNIGVMCGFATPSGNGQMLVHRCSSWELATPFTLNEQTRAPEFDYEPVVVVYRALPSPVGQAPALEALDVSRMSVPLVPKSFVWNSRAWPRSTEFYPFDPERPGRFSAEVNSQLLPAPQYSQWLVQAAQEDDLLYSILYKSKSNKHLQNRFLITGRVSASKVVKNTNNHHRDLLPLALRQGEEDQPIEMGMFRSTPEFKEFVRLISKTDKRWRACTTFGKAVKTWDFDGECVRDVRHRLLVLESVVVSQHDIEP